MGANRLRFLLESLADLDRSLRAHGRAPFTPLKRPECTPFTPLIHP